MPIDEFKSKLKPVFDEIVKRIPEDQHSSINYDEIVNASYDRLQEMKVGIEISDFTLEIPPDVRDPACLIAVLFVCWSAISIVMQCTGLSSGVSESIGREIAKKIAEGNTSTLRAIILTYNEGGNMYSKAKFVFELLSEIWNVIGLLEIIDAIRIAVGNWVRLIQLALVPIAQIIVWVASDGVAFVAQVVALFLKLPILHDKVMHALEKCQSYS